MVNNPLNSAPRGREHGTAAESNGDLISVVKEIQETIDIYLEKAGEDEKERLLRTKELATRVLLDVTSTPKMKLNAMNIKLDRLLANQASLHAYPPPSQRSYA